MTGRIRVQVGDADVSLGAIEIRTHDAQVNSQLYNLDDLLHAVNRVLCATAAQRDLPALDTLLTAARLVVNPRPAEQCTPDVLAVLTVIRKQPA